MDDNHIDDFDDDSEERSDIEDLQSRIEDLESQQTRGRQNIVLPILWLMGFSLAVVISDGATFHSFGGTPRTPFLVLCRLLLLVNAPQKRGGYGIWTASRSFGLRRLNDFFSNPLRHRVPVLLPQGR